jgi:hypothetical protein
MVQKRDLNEAKIINDVIEESSCREVEIIIRFISRGSQKVKIAQDGEQVLTSPHLVFSQT